ncbi:MAG: septum formation initiator [Campylobacter sp.]|nr:septum formation initiator [Campylobacter sp.]
MKARISKFLKATLCVVLCVAGGIYVGDVLFGDRSFEVLLKLQKEKRTLYNDIETLKQQNSIMQKKYLEKQLLEPDEIKEW